MGDGDEEDWVCSAGHIPLSYPPWVESCDQCGAARAAAGAPPPAAAPPAPPPPQHNDPSTSPPPAGAPTPPSSPAPPAIRDPLAQHVHTHTVHISDCDAYQMVYHTNYLRWCERARHAYFGRAALVGLLRERQLRVCLREARHARYFDSARLGDVLDIETRVAECDRSHVVFDHQVKRRDGGKLLFRLVADTVVVDAASGAAAQFPHSLLATGAALVPEGAAARKVSAFPGGSELTDPVPPQWHTWDEECEVDLTEAVSGAMSQDKIVDLWERARTTASMGPAGLRAMQLDPSLGGGNIFVVGRMDRVRFHATVLAVFGDKLQVRSCIEMRSVGGQRDVCAHWHQRLWRLGAGGAADALVAEGIVTMFSINAQQQPVPAGSLKAGLMPYMLPSVAGSG